MVRELPARHRRHRCAVAQFGGRIDQRAVLLALDQDATRQADVPDADVLSRGPKVAEGEQVLRSRGWHGDQLALDQLVARGRLDRIDKGCLSLEAGMLAV